MPFYFPLRYNFKPEEGQRSAEKLLILRQQLRSEVPQRTLNDTILIGTWNIRDFDSNKFGHGPRLKESIFYIAEIISTFDIVALQEVNENLTALNMVLKILGTDWDYITTDKVEGASGNRERMTFVFDTRKVHFQKIAGEIVLPNTRLIEGEQQFARTPFVVAFQSGWFKFMVCTVHIYYGSDTGEKLNRRIAEIESLANFLAKRADDEEANYILLGDFNIVSPQHKTMAALKKYGFIIPEGLSPSNIKLDKYYDQIAFKARQGQVLFSGRAGVFNPYKSVFTEEDRLDYYPLMQNKALVEYGSDGHPLDSPNNKQYYLEDWRTFQLSDHLPMWIELKIDFADDYLSNLLEASFDLSGKHPLSFTMPELEGL